MILLNNHVLTTAVIRDGPSCILGLLFSSLRLFLFSCLFAFLSFCFPILLFSCCPVFLSYCTPVFFYSCVYICLFSWLLIFLSSCMLFHPCPCLSVFSGSLSVCFPLTLSPSIFLCFRLFVFLSSYFSSSCISAFPHRGDTQFMSSKNRPFSI